MGIKMIKGAAIVWEWWGEKILFDWSWGPVGEGSKWQNITHKMQIAYLMIKN